MRRALALAALVACSSPAPRADDGTYHGRPIAPTCSHLGAAWLEREDREDREEPAKAIAALGLTRALVVADVGAGTGYFTRRIAPLVAHVYATDLQPEMLEFLEQRVAEAGLANVTAVRATERDAGLPVACCDVVLLVDVYHELSDPPAVLGGIARALKPGGRLVLIEYRGEDPAVPIKEVHKMTLPRIRAELGALGWTFVASNETLRDQRIVTFRFGAHQGAGL